MKTWKKIVLIVGVTTSLVGTALLGFGLFSGGVSDLYQKAKEPIQTYKKTLDKVESINLNIQNYGAFTIQTGDVAKPVLEYQNDENRKTNYSLDKGKLSITTTYNTKHLMEINGSLLSIVKSSIRRQSDIILTLPKNSKLNLLSGDTTGGPVNVEKISIKTVKLDSGYLNFENSNLTDSHISGTNMNFTDSSLANSDIQGTDISMIKTTITNSKLTSKDGRFYGEALTFLGKNELTATDIYLALNKYNLTVNHQLNSGDIDITKKLTPSDTNQLTIKPNQHANDDNNLTIE